MKDTIFDANGVAWDVKPGDWFKHEGVYGVVECLVGSKVSVSMFGESSERWIPIMDLMGREFVLRPDHKTAKVINDLKALIMLTWSKRNCEMGASFAALAMENHRLKGHAVPGDET